jgi:hypothetical protein
MAFGEIATACHAGFSSIKAWRWARRHGGFPDPAKVTAQGPIWTECQIATWLGELGEERPHYPDWDDDDDDSMLQEGEGELMAQAARKVTAKDANEKLAHRRLTVLELAERLGNVA